MRTGLRVLLVATAVALVTATMQGATTERTIYTFGAPGDGMYPYSKPAFDSKGNLYGTNQAGGTYGDGTVFELSPGTNGQWIETVIHTFAGGTDGESPSSGLIFDKAGNLYGTAAYGGANGSGVVFELSPQGSSWSYQVLYSFGAYPLSGDGFGPNSTLVFDKAGNLYGTTYEGGEAECFQGCGVVFELSPGPNGWTEKVLHAFASDGIDGEFPRAVVVAGNGALYGTTQDGGSAGTGVLYELRYSAAQQQWVETIVHDFTNGTDDGGFPESPLLISGNALYGTSEGGGVNGHGTVFQASYSRQTGWQTTVLYSFAASYTGEGFAPQTGLTVDKQGRFYGTTSYGGAYNYFGTVYQLANTNGTWVETTLHSFNGSDGFPPASELTMRNGSLFGTTSMGGGTSGLVYEVRP